MNPLPLDALVPHARALALSAHAGQVDKQGRDYFDAHLVPIAAALAPFGPEAEACGLLHDIKEDTDVTLEQLHDEGFSAHLIEAIASVTRHFYGREPYLDLDRRTGLIYRSAEHPLGALTKLADNTKNLLDNPDLARTDPAKALDLLNGRYLPARRVLLASPMLVHLTALDVFEMEVVLREHNARLAAERNTP